MAITDTAVGAILEIPTQAIKGIKDAERAIWALHDASKKAADQVYGDFGERMPRAFDKLIQKIREASGVIDGINGKTVNINMSNVEQSMTKAATTAQTQSQKISEAVTRLAYSDVDFSNINQLDARVKSLGLTYRELELALKDFNAKRTDKTVDSEEARTINNKIEALREYIRIKKMSEARQTTATTATDRDYLSEQKKILNDILTIRKQLNAEQLAGARKARTGADTSADRDNINKLLMQLREANTAYRELNRTKSESLSAKGQTDAENNVLRQEIALLREATSMREKLNQTVTRGTELANQAKLKSAGLGSSEDAIYQRTLTGLYQEQIKVLRDIGRVRADVASEGRRASDSEIEKLQLLADKYRTLQTAIGNMSGKYTKIDQNVKSNFNAERDRQIIDNAILKEQAERKYQETLAKTQQILLGKVDTTATLESIGRMRQEQQKMFDNLVRLQNLINQLKSERVDIQFNMKADLAKQIAPLADRIRELRKLTQQPLGTDKLREYYREMDILKGKIAQTVAAARSQSSANPALAGNQEQIDALTARYVALSAELRKVGIETDKLGTAWLQMNESNKAIDAQAQRILTLEQRLKNLNAIWERLKATNQAFDSSGKLSDKGQRIVRLQNELNEEIRLRKMTASEAKRYEEQKTRDAKAESDKRIAKAKKEAQEVRESLAAQKKLAISNPLGAMNYAKNATTLNQLTDAYKNLQSVMNRTDPKSSEWTAMNTQLRQTKQTIDDIKKKMGEVHSETQRTSNMMGNLQNRIAAAFSVSAILGFAKKVTEVRAQFELQRVALGAIIQDKDEANKVFLRVQQMALESPFSIMQLERSTKQIAAFGFEAKQLVPTMKMVADIGAGLGVELNRIVLVLGHMKARGYLEGTMVRQFTNMGFNVLGELAKYYTELEGRMVSVADVQERVKKKMVEFGDVEDVLKRVTSAGGMFYDMQKKQSDSIWGQMQRITDAYDLMLNEIGKSNEGVIKSALTAIRSLINSWRTIAPLLKDIAYIVGGIFAVKGVIAMVWQLNKLGIIIQGISVGWRGVAAAASTAATSMKLAWSSTGIGLLVAGVITAIEVIRGLNAEANALNEELGKIGEDNVKNLNDSIAQFVELADAMSSSSKTYNERAEAMKDMKRVFADILPMEKMEMDYIKGLNGNYTELIDTIAKYYQEKEYQQKYETIAGSKQAQESQRLIEETFERMNEDNKLGLIFSDSQIKAWADTLAAELNSGKLNNSIESIKKRVQEIFPDAKNIDSYFSEAFGKSDFTDVIDAVDKVRDAFGDISLSTADAANAMTMYNEQLGRMDFSQLDSEYEKVQQRINDIQERQSILKKQIPLAAPDVSKKYQEELADLQIQLTNYTNALDSVEQAQGRVLAQGFYDEVDKDTKRLTNLVQTYWDLGIEMKDLLKSGIQPTDKAYKDLEAEQNKVRASADELKTSHTAVNWTLIDNANSTYELNGQLTQIASNAFPNVSKRVVEMSNNLQLAFAKSKKTLYGFMMALADILPDSWKNKLPDFAKSYNMAVNEIAAIEGKLGEKTKEGNAALDERGKLYSDIATRNIEKYGAQTKRINEITKDNTKTSKDMAKDLRNEAKAWNEYVTAYEQSSNKESALKGMGLTEADIEQYRKNAKAAIAIADELWGEEKKGGKKGGKKGEDPIKKLWENRLDALKRYYEAAEKARKHLSDSETATEQRGSMSGLWSSLGLNQIKGLSLEELIGKGFDPEKLKSDYVGVLNELLKLIPVKYTELRNKVQETIASESIEIKFKLKEDSEEQLKKDLDRMFDSYDLSKTLKDANIPINLVPMVGGEPIASLDELRDRIQKQFEAEGGENASENRVKEYKDALKKIDDMEVKQQQERLKSYQQYLAVMYSDRAQTMIKSYTTLKNLERDFASYRANLEKEAADPATTEARRKEIAEQIKTLEQQAKDAIAGVKDEMDQKLNKFDWNAFKSSPVFTQMYSDIQTLSKKGIDLLITKLTTMRDKLQSMENVDYRAVREITQHIEKLNTQRIQLDSWKELNSLIKKSYDLRKKGEDMDTAQKNLMDAQADLDAANAEIDSLNTIINLKQQEGTEENKTKNLTSEQLALYGKSNDELQGMLKNAKKNANTAQDNVNKWNGVVDAHKKSKAALKRQLDDVKKLHDDFDKVYDSCIEVADALGADTEIWGDFAKGVGDSIFAVIELTIQLQIMGDAANMSMGIIGYIAIALQVIASLLTTIFSAHDKSLQKQIDKQQEKIDNLKRAYDKLKDSIDNAFKAASLQSDSRKALKNLEDQKKATEEMIRLEEKKKKTDKDQVKQWKEDLEDLTEEEEELRNSITEKWGGFGSQENYASAADEFASAWFDAFKETGDGLDALNDKWDEYIDNLIKQQIMLRVVGPRMERFLKMVDKYVSADSEQGEYLTRNELESLMNAKGEMLGGLNEELKMLMEYLGYGVGTGEYVLSDLQKGIQNITEPQAAAIEAYLNSMRFAVFRHTEQLDQLIAIVGAQYGVTADNPVVNELKGIRMVLDSIDARLDSVIKYDMGVPKLQVG